MAVERCANVEHFLPADALVTVPVVYLSWNSGAWVELEDAADADWVLTSVQLQPLTNAGEHNEVDIGVGAAGGEAVIATVRMIGKANYWSWGGMRLGLPVDAIPAGSRVAIRGRSFVAFGTDALKAGIGYLSKPLAEGTSISVATSGPKCVPSPTSWFAVAGSGVAWGWSAWGELVASASEDLVVVAVPRSMYCGGDCVGEVQLGIGGAGSETPVAWFPSGFSSYSYYASRTSCEPVVPLDAIPAGSRVAVRWRGNTTAATGVKFALMYHEKPL